MTSGTVSRLIQWYYLGTPIFFLLDRLTGFNFRVAFLDEWPTGKIIYYLIAFLLGIVAWRRPEWTARIGLLESTTDVVLIILSVLVWYGGALDAAGSETGMPVGFEAQALVNFVISALIAGVSYTIQRAKPA
jgi:hypothetical protein